MGIPLQLDSFHKYGIGTYMAFFRAVDRGVTNVCGVDFAFGVDGVLK